LRKLLQQHLIQSHIYLHVQELQSETQTEDKFDSY
jgi:hypothetical protein